MSFFRHIPGVKAAGGGGGYEVGQSCLIDHDPYLNGTKQVNGTNVWTASLWLKMLGQPDSMILSSGPGTTGATSFEYIEHNVYGQIFWWCRNSGSMYGIRTKGMFRDPSAWIHLVAKRNGAKDWTIFVNGVEQEVDYLYDVPLGQEATYINTTNFPTRIGSATHNPIETWGHYYISETHFIDGQALGPEHFAVDKADVHKPGQKGEWLPTPYTGDYGANGFYLPFNPGEIGTDHSGNDNDFTTSGITDDDIVADSPTNNWCTLNPLNNRGTLKEGNLEIDISAPNQFGSSSTIESGSGKWYAEFNLGAFNDRNVFMPGITAEAAENNSNNNFLGAATAKGLSWGYDASSGRLYNNGSNTVYGNAATTGDIIGIAMDLENSKLYFSINNTWQNSGVPTSGAGGASITSGEAYSFAVSDGSSGVNTSFVVNFGQRPFTYTPPEGYLALNSQNMENT